MKNSRVQKAFFGRLAPDDQLLRLFDFLPDVSFFIKDRQGRFMGTSLNKNEHFGVVHQGDAVGKTDHDFFTKQRADAFRADDVAVMESGEALVNRIEAAPEVLGSPRMVMTTKIPLRDRAGRVIGIAGFSRPIDQLGGSAVSDDGLAKVIGHMHHHFGNPLTSGALAKMAGLSVSQFERRFQQGFGTSPRKYLMRIRVEGAARLLADTNRTVSEIALECGFADHSHLSRSFKRMMQMPPTAYRKLHQSTGAV